MNSLLAYNIINEESEEIFYNSIDAIKCPICDVLQIPNFNNSLFVNNKTYLLCYCSHCKNVYIIEYQCNIDEKGQYKLGNFLKAYPNDFKHSTFDECIKSLSPTFIKIYNQALTADSFNLDEIAGMGYRKALEFLIKDYAKSLKIEVNNKSLSDVIDLINDPYISQIAKPCIKILNDETHYFRKFEKVEISDIDKLIKAIVNLITAKQIASGIIYINS